MPAEWLSQTGWGDIKFKTQNLFLLDSPEIEAKSIKILGSQCQVCDASPNLSQSLSLTYEQMVGQGIFKVREITEKKTRFKFFFSSRKLESKNNVETWTRLVSRSILYRINSNGGAPGAHSGTAVCMQEELEDGSLRARVAGFSSFAQHVSDVQRFDLEGARLYTRLQEGRVAFYGAFEAPAKLRDEHSIVQ